MAKRYTLAHTPEVRAKIQASQIANRLQQHVNGEVELTATQVNAAKILLAKTIPDLSAVTLSNDPENPIGSIISPADADLINRYLKQKESK